MKDSFPFKPVQSCYGVDRASSESVCSVHCGEVVQLQHQDQNSCEMKVFSNIVVLAFTVWYSIVTLKENAPKNKNVVIYSFSCCSKTVWLSFEKSLQVFVRSVSQWGLFYYCLKCNVLLNKEITIKLSSYIKKYVFVFLISYTVTFTLSYFTRGSNSQ